MPSFFVGPIQESIYPIEFNSSVASINYINGLPLYSHESTNSQPPPTANAAGSNTLSAFFPKNAIY